MAEYVSLKRDNSYLNKGRSLLTKWINRDYRIHVCVYTTCIYIEFHITNPERNKLNHSINDKQSIIENDRQMKCSMQLVISGTAEVTNRTN
jgi:hypothetical protein